MPENVVCLCKLCHTEFHGGYDWAIVGRNIGENLDDEELAYILRRANPGYASRYYMRSD